MVLDTTNQKELLLDSILKNTQNIKKVKRFKNIWYNQVLEIKENIDTLFSEEKVIKIKN
jgi:hypothetical protein